MKKVMKPISAVALGIAAFSAGGGNNVTLTPEMSGEVPDGAIVREVSAEQLAQAPVRHVVFTREVTIGGESDGALLTGPLSIAVAADGRIFALGRRATSIQVFTPDGDEGDPIGREGQGPGELSGNFVRLAMAGRELAVVDPGNSRLTRFTLAGEHLGDARFTEGMFLLRLYGTSAGEVFALSIGHPRKFNTLVQLEVGDHEVVANRLTGFPLGSGAGARRTSSGKLVQFPGTGGALHTVSRDGRRYSAFTRLYEVLSTAADGEAWVLKGPVAPVSVSVDDLPELPPPPAAAPQPTPLAASRVELPAIHTMKTDGAGRLYVCPYNVPRPDGLAACHVYSSGGELEFTALMPEEFAAPGGVWKVAMGDHVYGEETDERTQEIRLVRHRMTVEPGGE